MLFDIRRTTLLRIAACLGLMLGSVRAEPARFTIKLVNQTAPGETNRLTIALAAEALGPGQYPMQRFDVRVGYDATRLRLTDLRAADSIADRCDLHFIITPFDTIWPGQWTVWIGVWARSPALAPSLSDTSALDLVHLVFETLDSGRTGSGGSELGFCWLKSDDNCLRPVDPDTVFASNHMFDPDSLDISCTNSPLPNRCGLPDSILSLLNENGSGAVRGVDFYRLRVVLGDPTAVDSPDRDDALPSDVVLHQNYPNPFNGATRISFDLARAAAWRLIIINPLGQTVWTAEGTSPAGRINVDWDGCGADGLPIAAGVYLYRLETGRVVVTRKLLLLK